MFSLDPQLAKDTVLLGRLRLCQLLLMNDSNYPWFILVPERENLRELHELSDTDSLQFLEESTLLARALNKGLQPYKLNIAALGNVVSQLHVHHIVRYQYDPAWPAPVWGKLPAKPYYSAEISKLKDLLTRLMGRSFTPT